MDFDFNHLIELIPEINEAFFQTIYMISISLIVAIVIGLPVGILLYVTEKGLFWENGSKDIRICRQFGPFDPIYYFISGSYAMTKFS